MKRCGWYIGCAAGLTVWMLLRGAAAAQYVGLPEHVGAQGTPTPLPVKPAPYRPPAVGAPNSSLGGATRGGRAEPHATPSE